MEQGGCQLAMRSNIWPPGCNKTHGKKIWRVESLYDYMQRKENLGGTKWRISKHIRYGRVHFSKIESGWHRSTSLVKQPAVYIRIARLYRFPGQTCRCANLFQEY